MCYKRNLTSVPNIFLSSCIYRVAKNRLISIWCFVLQNQMYLYRVLFCKRLKLGLAGKVLSGIYQLSFCNSSKIHGLWFDLIQDAEEFFHRNCLSLRESLLRQLCFVKEFSQHIQPFIHMTKPCTHQESCCSLTKKFQCGIKAEGRRKRNHSLGGI